MCKKREKRTFYFTFSLSTAQMTCFVQLNKKIKLDKMEKNTYVIMTTANNQHLRK